MLLYIIRHGVPDYTGDTLTPLGQRQAEAVGRRLASTGLDRIYSSPLGRARETARPAAELLDKPVEIEEWASENLAWHDFSKVYPDGKRGWVFAPKNMLNLLNPSTANDDVTNFFRSPAFDGTNAEEGYARIRAASDGFLARQGYVREGMAYRVERHSEERVAMFCHQGFGLIWLAVLLQIPPQYVFTGFDMTHTGVTVLQFTEGVDGYTVPRCVALSDTAHIYAEHLPMRYKGGFAF